MAGLPADASKGSEEEFEFDLDFDLEDLDNMDDEELQRLLDEDPTLEAELKALEETDIAGDEPTVELPDAFPQETASDAYMRAEEEPALDIETPPVLETNSVVEPEVNIDEPPHLPSTQLAEVDDLDDESYEAPPIAPPAPFEEPVSVDSDGPAFDLPPSSDVAGEYEFDQVDATQLNLAPIPRINIHAFCVNERTTALMEAVARDRRLSKAHMTIHAGDSGRASEIYAGEVSPSLIIIEANDNPTEFIAGLDQLASVCDPSTRVICIGDLNDIRLYRDLMDRGISEYLVNPKSPLQIISSIGDLYADPAAPSVGRSFVFVGARGGVGSSTICHNAAWALSEECKSDTILMDLDLAFGTASLDFEHDPSQGLAEALAAPERLDDVLLDRLLQKCTDRLSLFVAPNMLDRDYDMPPESYETVVEMVRKAAPSVAIDLPHLWSGWARHLLQTADEIVITATPDLASFRNAKNLIETVKSSRSNDSEPIVILNQVGVPKRPEVPADQFEEALGIAPHAIIPWDPVSFGLAATNAETVITSAPKSKPTAAFRSLAARLTGQDLHKSSGSLSLKSLFSKNR